MKIDLKFIDGVFYAELDFFGEKDFFLIDTGFSSGLSLKKSYKNKISDLDTCTSFSREFTLADGSKKIITEYYLIELNFLDGKINGFFSSFNEDENIIGNKFLEKIGGKLEIDYKKSEGFLIF